MADVFLKIVNMSISASWLVLAVLVFRFVLKKAPKWIHVLLWGIVAVRLLCPFSIESALSLIPSAETIPTQIMEQKAEAELYDTAMITIVDNPVLPEVVEVSAGTSEQMLRINFALWSIIWGIGIACFGVYTSISYWRLRKRIKTAVLFRDNIFQSEAVSSPFVLGIIKPKIYLPFQIDGQNLEHVVSHEQAHIRRRDHWWKPLGFLLLTIHWFNPLMWLAYVLLCRDIELACDEKVVKELGKDQRADYSQALLACSVNRRMIAACPLAFGEVGVKERVKSVLNYKKPAFWVIVVSAIACAVVAVCFLTNPIDAIEGYYHVEGYGIYNDSEYYVVVNDGVELKCTKEQHEQVASLMERFRTGEMQDTPIRVKYKQFLISYKRGTVIELEIPENESFGKTYVYENEGIMGSFTITLYNDGTFTYYEGMASSYLGFGSWKQEGDIITMTDDGHGGLGVVNRFKLDGDDLIFVEDGSFNFIYVKVQDGERFHCTGEAFKPADAITQHGNNETLSLGDIVTLSKKGYDLTWSDFDQYKYIETGSGLYIRVYEINEMYELWIGGGWTDEDPMYIYLALADDLDTRIDIRDGGVTEFIGADHSEVLLAKAINEAILDHFKASKPDGLLHCASFVSLAQQELCIDSEPASPMQVTVYGMALHEKYGYSGATFHTVDSWYNPVKLTFEKTPNGAFRLSDAWFPKYPAESAEQHGNDIYEQFSMHSENLANSVLFELLDYNYLTQLKQECYDQAVRYGGVDTHYVAEQLFDKIEASFVIPFTASSRPQGYTASHLSEYKELTYYGNYTLQYIFSQFLEGNQIGLRGHLMREVLDDLAPEAQLRLYAETGQAYFDEWKAGAIRISEQHDMDWIKEHQPAIWLFLQMDDE